MYRTADNAFIRVLNQTYITYYCIDVLRRQVNCWCFLTALDCYSAILYMQFCIKMQKLSYSCVLSWYNSYCSEAWPRAKKNWHMVGQWDAKQPVWWRCVMFWPGFIALALMVMVFKVYFVPPRYEAAICVDHGMPHSHP